VNVTGRGWLPRVASASAVNVRVMSTLPFAGRVTGPPVTRTLPIPPVAVRVTSALIVDVTCMMCVLLPPLSVSGKVKVAGTVKFPLVAGGGGAVIVTCPVVMWLRLNCIP